MNAEAVQLLISEQLKPTVEAIHSLATSMARSSEDRRIDEQKRLELECLRMEEEKERHKEQMAMAEQHQIIEKERAARE